MLTANLVRARVNAGELRIAPLDGRLRARILGLGQSLLEITRGAVGQSRDSFEAAIKELQITPRDRKLAEGLLKLIEDRCEWEAETEVDPLELRRRIFEASAKAWQSLEPGRSFDRNAVLTEVAAAAGTTAEKIEHTLFADLRGSHRLLAIRPFRLEDLPDIYHRAEAQAVLLRATRIHVLVRCRSALALRFLFRRLKFLQLLFTVHEVPQGHRLVIDGPFSLFESGTKYGLKLALLLPALDVCDDWSLEAELRWGKDRTRALFRLRGGGGEENARATSTVPRDGTKAGPALLGDAAEQLHAALVVKKDSGWKAHISTALLNLPGVGVCIPDLELHKEKTGEVVYVEVLGYWSRDAVWRRVQLVEKGMKERIVFVVSDKLRVSEAALPEELPSALYVYKRTPSADRLLEAANKLTKKRVRR